MKVIYVIGLSPHIRIEFPAEVDARRIEEDQLEETIHKAGLQLASKLDGTFLHWMDGDD
jgi:hypothetical protein